MPSTNRRAWLLGTVVALLALGALAGCGDDDDEDSGGAAATTEEAPAPTPTPLAITTSDAASKRFTVEAPTTIKGGLVEMTFTNAGKEPHEAQLVRIDGAHTAEEALKLIVDEETEATPEWIRGAGGAGSTGPGQTVTATLNLPAGKYLMFDNENMEGPPNATRGAMAEFEVTAGEEGDLPASTAKIVAASDKDADPEHSFEVSGLKVGKNRLLLDNKGEELHHAIMFPIARGKKLADVKEFLETEGQPSGPPPLDFENGAGTAVLDGDTSQVSDLTIRKAGTYAVLCFLTNRDGKGKSHFAEGMLEEVVVK